MSRGEIPKLVQDELDLLTEKGIAWRVEKGAKHLKLVIAGRLVGIFSRGKNDRDDRTIKNLRSSVRRAAREAT